MKLKLKRSQIAVLPATIAGFNLGTTGNFFGVSSILVLFLLLIVLTVSLYFEVQSDNADKNT